MKAWFAGLESREQSLIVAAAIILLCLLLYLGVWQPWQNNLHQLRAEVTQQEQNLAAMQVMADQVKALQTAGKGSVSTRSGQSLLGLVDSGARSRGLGKAMKRVQPDGSQRVRVWLEDASFDVLMDWLVSLQQGQGVTISSAVFEATGKDNGLVNARLVIETAG